MEKDEVKIEGKTIYKDGHATSFVFSIRVLDDDKYRVDVVKDNAIQETEYALSFKEAEKILKKFKKKYIQ